MLEEAMEVIEDLADLVGKGGRAEFEETAVLDTAIDDGISPIQAGGR
jgi:hypothetical protein